MTSVTGPCPHPQRDVYDFGWRSEGTSKLEEDEAITGIICMFDFGSRIA